MIQEIKNKKDLDNIINNNNLLLIDFYSNVCVPCRQVLKTLENIDNIKKVKVNIDKNVDLVKEYNVTGLPFIIIMKNKEILERIYAPINLEKIKNKIPHIRRVY